jgi:hypothetical protein
MSPPMGGRARIQTTQSVRQKTSGSARGERYCAAFERMRSSKTLRKRM